MEDQKKPIVIHLKEGELEELFNGRAMEKERDKEKTKKKILTKEGFFASFGFYMPDFEAAVKTLDYEQVNSVSFCSLIFIEYSQRHSTIREFAMEGITQWKKEFSKRISFSPFPENVIANEREEMEYKRANRLGTNHFRRGALPEKDDPYEKGIPPTNDYIEMGYQDAMAGIDKPLQTYLYQLVYWRFDDSYLLYRSFPKMECFIDPKILSSSLVVSLFWSLKYILDGYEYAHREGYLRKVETMLNAGKSVAEIRAELFPETEGEGNLKNLETPAPEPSPQSAEPELLTESQKPVLCVLETVLLYFYQRAPMTRETAEKIAKECSESADHIYSTEYVFKIVRECSKPETRQQRGKGKRAKENRLQILKRLTEYLPKNQILEEDIRTVTTAKNKAKK